MVLEEARKELLNVMESDYKEVLKKSGFEFFEKIITKNCIKISKDSEKICDIKIVQDYSINMCRKCKVKIRFTKYNKGRKNIKVFVEKTNNTFEKYGQQLCYTNISKSLSITNSINIVREAILAAKLS